MPASSSSQRYTTKTLRLPPSSSTAAPGPSSPASSLRSSTKRTRQSSVAAPSSATSGRRAARNKAKQDEDSRDEESDEEDSEEEDGRATRSMRKDKDGEDLWTVEMDEVLRSGMAIIPMMGRRSVILESDGQTYGRNGLLGEYLRRQTGKIRNRTQMASHLVLLRKRCGEDTERKSLVLLPASSFSVLTLVLGSTVLSLLDGHALPSSTPLQSINFDQLLGPDLHPETFAAAAEVNNAVKATRTFNNVKRRQSLQSVRKNAGGSSKSEEEHDDEEDEEEEEEEEEEKPAPPKKRRGRPSAASKAAEAAASPSKRRQPRSSSAAAPASSSARPPAPASAPRRSSARHSLAAPSSDEDEEEEEEYKPRPTKRSTRKKPPVPPVPPLPLAPTLDQKNEPRTGQPVGFAPPPPGPIFRKAATVSPQKKEKEKETLPSMGATQFDPDPELKAAVSSEAEVEVEVEVEVDAMDVDHGPGEPEPEQEQEEEQEVCADPRPAAGQPDLSLAKGAVVDPLKPKQEAVEESRAVDAHADGGVQGGGGPGGGGWFGGLKRVLGWA
ncbi:hypothetical protein JCM5296_000930 [Sporobolomyces johnsonii]